MKVLLYKLFGRGSYVIADPRDNSLTFSKKLCGQMDVFNLSNPKIYVTKLTNKYDISYAMVVNPPLACETQLSDIQYNKKYRCVGIESLCPTVNRIFYDYGLASGKLHRLSIRKGKTDTGDIEYFEIVNPNE